MEGKYFISNNLLNLALRPYNTIWPTKLTNHSANTN